MHDAPPSVRRRNLRLFLLGVGVSILGDRMVAVALAFGVLEVGGSPADVGIVLAAGTLPLVASVLVGGVIADRVSRRRVMITADVARVATQGATAALLLAGAAEIWSLALLAALTGLAQGFFSPASTGLLPQFVPDADLQRANGLRSVAKSVGEIGGPLLAGVLVAAAGAGAAIAVDAATFAVSAACLAALALGPDLERAPATFLDDLRGGWDAFRSRRWVWTVVVYFALGNIMWAAWSTLGPVVADTELGGAGAWGLTLAGMGVGFLLGGLVATRIDPPRPLVAVALAEVVLGVPMAFLAGGAPAGILTVAATFSGAAIAVGESVFDSTLQRQVPADALSRVSSYDWFGSLAFFPAGMVLWGVVAEAIGASTALWIAFGGLLAMAVTLLALPDIRALRRDTPQPVSTRP